jgi:hypothetical protein
MTKSKNVYIVEEYDRQPGGTRYFFVSEGDRLLVKVVEYRFIGLKEGKHTYNLGFGTYNQEGNSVCDDDISENGDAYKVFNTVLSTIPHFLHNYTGALVMVEGSDSTISFPETCRPNCKKKCIPPACKNAHRRINIYKNFVNKNFDLLSQEYKFLGGIKNNDYQSIIDDYTIPNNYDSVFFMKK